MNGKENCDYTLPWYHYFWMTTKPTTTVTARIWTKNNVYVKKQQLCTCIKLFCTVLCHRCTTTTRNFLGLWQKLSLSFPNLDNHRYGPKGNFAKICQIKWNWIRSVKSEIVRIDFEVTLSVCCHPNILPPWQRDVTTSPLYWQDHKLIKRWDFNS